MRVLWEGLDGDDDEVIGVVSGCELHAFSHPTTHHHHTTTSLFTMHPCTNHAPTHAQPSLPVDPYPNPTPPNLYPSGLHDTAAKFKIMFNSYDSTAFIFIIVEDFIFKIAESRLRTLSRLWSSRCLSSRCLLFMWQGKKISGRRRRPKIQWCLFMPMVLIVDHFPLKVRA